MAIKRYDATKDNTITNAFKNDLITRGTGSNMGLSDILEVFSIYGQASVQGTGSEAGDLTQELTRFIVQFPVSGSSAGEIKADRTSGDIPQSGSVKFYLRLFNAKHGHTLPRNAKYVIQAVSQSWTEGTGLDMDEYKNIGVSNWLQRKDLTTWGKPGGSYWSGSYSPGNTFPTYEVTQEIGTEDFEVDITSMVEEWIAGTQQNYGLGVRLTSSLEGYFSSSAGVDNTTTGVLQNVSGSTRSYYTKKVFARGTEFFFKKPTIEARWDSSEKDNRGNFFYSSSLAPTADNLNTLYLYNYIDGQLKNIPGLTNNLVYVQVFSGSSNNTVPAGTNLQIVTGTMTTSEKFYVTGGLHKTGIYTASFCLSASSTNTLTKIFDVWSAGAGSNVQYYTGSFDPRKRYSSQVNPTKEFVTTIQNIKSSYKTTEKAARFRLFTRFKNWNPNLYVKATNNIENNIIEDGYYKIFRVQDDLEIIPYGTGSTAMDYTRMSYDVSGNYFDLDMSLLKKDAMYGIKFSYYINGNYQEQPETFTFRVEN